MLCCPLQQLLFCSTRLSVLIAKHADVSIVRVTTLSMMSAQTAPAPLEQRVAFVGAGNMASALIRGLIASRTLASSNITASSPSGGTDSLRSLGIHTTKSNAECVARADVVILAVKPLYLNEAIGGMRDHVKADTLIVSIVAGVTLDTIQQVI
jgi:ornithine cyclodeaminase/alanine dehydrogenase-like protein (mu-crystallin family)